MTKEEYESIEYGMKVCLVDNIEEIAISHGDLHVIKHVFIPDDIYEVGDLSDNYGEGWVSIVKNAEGSAGHGWPYDRWQLCNEPVVDNLYELLGIEVSDGNDT